MPAAGSYAVPAAQCVLAPVPLTACADHVICVANHSWTSGSLNVQRLPSPVRCRHSTPDSEAHQSSALYSRDSWLIYLMIAHCSCRIVRCFELKRLLHAINAPTSWIARYHSVNGSTDGVRTAFCIRVQARKTSYTVSQISPCHVRGNNVACPMTCLAAKPSYDTAGWLPVTPPMVQRGTGCTLLLHWLWRPTFLLPLMRFLCLAL